MNPIAQTLLIIIAAVITGSLVNMTLILLGPLIVSPPPGVDMSDMESFAAGVETMGPQHFLFPFLAHALGTFSGSALVYRFAIWRRRLFTALTGVFFLAGGIAAATMIPAPTWFIVTDLALAYLPMAWLATRLINFPNKGQLD